MEVYVINGSPRGKYSTSIQNIRYIEKLYSKLHFTIVNAAQQIKYYENHIDEIIDGINKADLVIFSYPVYSFLVPSQLHRIIELLKEKNVCFHQKVVTQICQSKHFYDITAMNFMELNFSDLCFKYVNGLSLDMDDLQTKKGQELIQKFFKHLLFCYENNIYDTIESIKYEHQPVLASHIDEKVKDKSKTICIVTDRTGEDDALNAMINRFSNEVKYQVKVVNIRNFPFHNGCIGCLSCLCDGKCVFKDGFDSYLRNEIQSCDAFVYAFTIKDHSMGSIFKKYDDRNFCNGHRTVTRGKPVGYLVNGNISIEMMLYMVLVGKADVGGNYLAGTVDSTDDVDRKIDKLACNIEYALENDYEEGRLFLGVGGAKIFRDLVYKMRGMCTEDYKFFKQNNMFDFPQKEWTESLKMYAAGLLFKDKKIKAKYNNMINEGMLMGYKKLIDNTDPID